MIRLDDLSGKHIFSGIEQGVVKETGGDYMHFTLDGITYRAVEVTDGEHRSHMEGLEIVDGPCRLQVPDTEVVCHYSKGRDGDDDILIFFNIKNGEMILCIGTKDYGDCYSYCVMQYAQPAEGGEQDASD